MRESPLEIEPLQFVDLRPATQFFQHRILIEVTCLNLQTAITGSERRISHTSGKLEAALQNSVRFVKDPPGAADDFVNVDTSNLKMHLVRQF